MSSTRAGPLLPGTSAGSVASARSRGKAPPSALACNLCRKPLATTCFLCACDCIFCEECTYSHFEQSSECPTCHRTLRENDFTELVVADDNGSDMQKTCLQTLFTKKSGTGNLPFSDLCHGLINHLDVAKTNTKFLLKQLLVQSHTAGRSSAQAARAYEALKAENTQLKQMISSQRLQYEQSLTTMQNKLKAKEAEAAEQKQMLAKFQRFHGGGGSGGGGGSNVAPHMVPNSSSASLSSSSRGGGSEPPLRGLMAQREANKRAQHNALHGGPKRPAFMNGMNRRASPANNHGGGGFRPHSSSSSGGGSMASSARPIRDLTANAGYHFSGVSNQTMNKRRRGGTPNSLDNGTPRHAMSPNTAFALNQGPHTRNVFHR